MLQLNTEEMKNYYNGLPPYLQETIRQSGADISTLAQLKSAAENLLKGGKA